MPLIKPLNGTSICNIYLGLIDQFHYVALVKKFKYECRTTIQYDLEEKERAEDEGAFDQSKGTLFETT